MLSVEHEPDELRIVSVNMEKGLGASTERARKEAAAQYLGSILARAPDVLFVSEATREGDELSSDITRIMMGYNAFHFPDNDEDGRADRNTNTLWYRPKCVQDEDIHIERFNGRDAADVIMNVGGRAVRGVFVHGYDRPASERDEQMREVAEFLVGKGPALAAGDMNTIDHTTWQAQFLRRRWVKWLVDKLPETDPGQQAPQVHFNQRLHFLEPAAQWVVDKANRVGSLANRLVGMAEADGSGPLQTLQQKAGLVRLAGEHRVTRSLVGIVNLELGVEIDHIVGTGLESINSEVIPAQGASDHHAVAVSVRVLSMPEKLPGANPLSV